MIRVHAIKTGLTRIRTAQTHRKTGGALRVLTDRQWTEWLPIYAWVIEHPEGLIVVDTGETSRTGASGYLPAWHPYYRLAVEFDVKPQDEIGPRLRSLGMDPEAVKTVILTHLHTDHAGGLHHFPRSRILAPEQDFRTAGGIRGKLNGYLPHRWPQWFDPKPISFIRHRVGPFAQICPVTKAGDVVIVPTPGHTPGHVSVIVQMERLSYLFAGDASYSEEQLLGRWSDGVSPNASISIATLDRMSEYVASISTVYLPAHDPLSEERLLAKKTTVPESPEKIEFP